MRTLLICVALFFQSYASCALADDTGSFFKSLTSKIKSFHAEADGTIRKGIWQSTLGDSQMIWRFSNANRLSINLNYDRGVVSNSSAEFARVVLVEVRTSDLCATFKVKKIKFSDTGIPDLDESDVELVSSPGCTDSAGGEIEFANHLRLAADSGDLFQGRFFAGTGAASPDFGVAAQIVKCNDPKCKRTSRDSGPFSLVVFRSSNPDQPAFSAQLRQDELIFPGGNNLTIREGSMRVRSLTYDVVNKRGTGFLEELTIIPDSGQLNVGDTKLLIEAGRDNEFSLKNVRIGADGDTFEGHDGTFKAALANGSTLILGYRNSQDSRVKFASVDAKLIGFRYAVSETSREITAEGGYFKGVSADAQLLFGKGTSLRTASSRIAVTFACDLGSVPCKPISWRNKEVNVRGTIDQFDTAVTGGELELSDVGKVHIDHGSISLRWAKFDSSNRVSPITGEFSDFRFSFSAEDLKVDDGLIISAASMDAVSTDIGFKDGDPFPSGTLRIEKGEVASIRGSTIATIPFTTAQFSFDLHRDPFGNVGVENGTLTGSFRVAIGVNGAADASVEITRLSYKDGQGSADAHLAILNASYTLATASKEMDEKFYYLTLRSIPVYLNLVSHFEMDLGFRAERKRWSLKEPIKKDIVVNADVRHNDDPELQMLSIEARAAGIKICTAKADPKTFTYQFKGIAEVDLLDNQPFLRVGDFQMDTLLQIEKDTASCKRASVLICDILPNITFWSGTNGLGGLAAASVCGVLTIELEKEKTEEFRQTIATKIREFEYTLTR